MRFDRAITKLILLSALLTPNALRADGSRHAADSCAPVLQVRILRNDVPSAFSDLAKAHHRIKVAHQTLEEFVGPKRFVELDHLLAEASAAQVDRNSPEIQRLNEIYRSVEAAFREILIAVTPDLFVQMRARLERAEAFDKAEKAKSFRTLIQKLEGCLAHFESESCGPILRRAKNAVAADYLARPGSVDVPTVGRASDVISNIAHNLGRYVGVDELVFMERELSHLKTEGAPMTTPRAQAVMALIHAVGQRFFTDFRTHVGQVMAELRAHLAHSGDKAARQLMNRLHYCRDHLTLDDCASSWRSAQQAPWSTLWPPTPEELERRTLAAGVTTRPAQPTGGDFAFVDTLTPVGSVAQREAFRAALEDAYLNEKAIAREQVRAANANLDTAFAQVEDLGRALSIFTETPVVVRTSSKVVLRGPVRANGQSITVDVTFDPRTRYFTVTTPTSGEAEPGYYLLMLSKDGQLSFLGETPVHRVAAGRCLPLSHFSY